MTAEGMNKSEKAAALVQASDTAFADTAWPAPQNLVPIPFRARPKRRLESWRNRISNGISVAARITGGDCTRVLGELADRLSPLVC
jgi:hypothetical protein